MDERLLRRACEVGVRTCQDEPAYRHTSHLTVVVDGWTVLDEHLGAGAQVTSAR